MKTLWLFFVFCTLSLSSFAQSGYYIEIPKGFERKQPIGKNVDLTAVDSNGSSIVVVKVNIPSEYSLYTIWDILGDLDSYMIEYADQGREYGQKPKIIDYGKTIVSNTDSFWYDHTVDNGGIYNKTYQVKKNNMLYTITFSCYTSSKRLYEPIWFRVKNSIKL